MTYQAMRDLGPRGRRAAFPVGTSWSTIMQTRATMHNHERTQEKLVEVIDQLKGKEDLTRTTANGMTRMTTPYANRATERPTTTQSRSTSPSG